MPQILVGIFTFMGLKNTKEVNNIENRLSLYKHFKRCKWVTLSIFSISLAVTTKQQPQNQNQRVHILFFIRNQNTNSKDKQQDTKTVSKLSQVKTLFPDLTSLVTMIWQWLLFLLNAEYCLYIFTVLFCYSILIQDNVQSNWNNFCNIHIPGTLHHWKMSRLTSLTPLFKGLDVPAYQDTEDFYWHTGDILARCPSCHQQWLIYKLNLVSLLQVHCLNHWATAASTLHHWITN